MTTLHLARAGSPAGVARIGITQAVAGWARPLARRASLELPSLAAVGPVATVGGRMSGCAESLELAVLVGIAARDGDERIGPVIELEPGADREDVRAAPRSPFDRMGRARPDVVLFAPVPLSGRSRKPDRTAAARLVAAAPAMGPGAPGCQRGDHGR